MTLGPERRSCAERDMRADFAGSCPKDLAEPESNEDKFVLSEDGSRLALCDGASESYDSRMWATQLASQFVEDPKFDVEWMHRAVVAFNTAHDFEAMSWSKQSAFERGSFSTLLGVEHDASNGVLDVLAIGDCIALLLDGDGLVEAWPFGDPERFKEHPTLLATLPAHNAFISELGFWTASHTTWRLDRCKSPRVLCLSDALAEWALRGADRGTARLSQLAAMKSEQQLCDLVVAERSAKELRVDDSTLLVLSFASSSSADAVPDA